MKKKKARKKKLRLLAPQRLRHTDFWILFAIIVLIISGLTAIFSASIYSSYYEGGSPVQYLVKQALGVALGGIGYFLAITIPNKRYIRIDVLGLLLVICIILLVLVLFTPPVLGASRWIPLGPLSFQPSELTKIVFVLFLAKWFSEFQDSMYLDLRKLWKYFFFSTEEKLSFIRSDRKFWKRFQFEWGVPVGLFAIIAILLKLEPDNGSIVVLLLSSGVLFTIAFLRDKRWIIAISLLFALAMGGILGKTSIASAIINVVGEDSHIAVRFRAWADPMSDPQGDGYQLTNSYVAIAKGGIWGVGIGNGTQKQGFLPEGHTDFILANIAEESGLVGIGAILALFFLIIGRINHSALKTNRPDMKLILVGLNTLFFIQVLWNAAGISGMLPMKGLTSPLLSYGGTSVLFTCLLLGLAQGVIAEERYRTSKEKQGLEHAIYDDGKRKIG